MLITAWMLVGLIVSTDPNSSMEQWLMDTYTTKESCEAVAAANRKSRPSIQISPTKFMVGYVCHEIKLPQFEKETP